MRDLFDTLFCGYGHGFEVPQHYSSTTDKDGTGRLQIPVPGAGPEDVQVDVVSGGLTVEAPTFDGARRRYRVYVRDDLDVTTARATVKNGVLTIEIPPREDRRPRRITVGG